MPVVTIRSWIGIGNYDANILMCALKRRGLNVVWFDSRQQVKSKLYMVRISSLEFSNSCKHNLIEQNQLTWISYNYSATGIQLDDQKTNNMNIVTILIWRCFNQEQERNPLSYQGLESRSLHVAQLSRATPLQEDKECATSFERR